MDDYYNIELDYTKDIIEFKMSKDVARLIKESLMERLSSEEGYLGNFLEDLIEDLDLLIK